MKILTVLRSGGNFRPEHVYAVQRMCEEHLPNTPFQFFCLTDLELDCPTIKLAHGWPGWWSKLELFKQLGPCLYFDLDVIITGNIDDLVASISSTDVCMLRDQWYKCSMNSTMMYWDGDLTRLYDKFSLNPDVYMKKFRGDQNFIGSYIGKHEWIQNLSDESVVSFKFNIKHGKLYNPDLHKIVFFHGRPRPWNQKVIDYSRYIP